MDKQAWLDQVVEETLEPDLKICDPHHHLGEFPSRRYLLDELLADIGSGHNVVSTVFVECGAMLRAVGPESMRPVGETEFVNGVAAMSASGTYGDARVCAGIVSFADVLLGAAVGDVLDAHLAASQRFRGIRHSAAWDASDEIRKSHADPPQGMLGNSVFLKGFAELGRRGLTFDAWMFHPQIPELTDLAAAFPDQTIVFNHFGGPLGIGPYAGRRDEIFPWWKDAVAELAKCENVVAKLGGLVMAINGFDFHTADRPPTSKELAAATQDYYLHMIDCFGVARCMFESNYPADRVSTSYHVLWNSFKRITKDFSDSEKAALYHDTATRSYRIEVCERTRMERCHRGC